MADFDKEIEQGFLSAETIKLLTDSVGNSLLEEKIVPKGTGVIRLAGDPTQQGLVAYTLEENSPVPYVRIKIQGETAWHSRSFLTIEQARAILVGTNNTERRKPRVLSRLERAL